MLSVAYMPSLSVERSTATACLLAEWTNADSARRGVGTVALNLACEAPLHPFKSDTDHDNLLMVAFASVARTV